MGYFLLHNWLSLEPAVPLCPINLHIILEESHQRQGDLLSFWRDSPTVFRSSEATENHSHEVQALCLMNTGLYNMYITSHSGPLGLSITFPPCLLDSIYWNSCFNLLQFMHEVLARPISVKVIFCLVLRRINSGFWRDITLYTSFSAESAFAPSIVDFFLCCLASLQLTFKFNKPSTLHFLLKGWERCTKPSWGILTCFPWQH